MTDNLARGLAIVLGGFALGMIAMHLVAHALGVV